MKGKGSTKSRPEQLLIHEILDTHITTPGIQHMELEYKIPEPQLLDSSGINDLHLSPILDIFVDAGVWFDIEVNGPIHDEPSQINKDELRYLFLSTRKKPFISIVIDYKECPTIFLRNKRLLSDGELILAYAQLYKSIQRHITLERYPQPLWLRTSVHRKALMPS